MTTLTFTVCNIQLLIFLVLITSCSSKKEQNKEAHEHTEGGTSGQHRDEMEMDSTEMHGMDATHMAYACPMHPEVTGKESDKCPKCGMNLEPVKKSDSTEHEQ